MVSGLGQSLEKEMAVFLSENSMDRGAGWATVHRVTKGQTRVSDQYFQFHIHNCTCIYVYMGREMDIYTLITIWFRHQYRNSEF